MKTFVEIFNEVKSKPLGNPIVAKRNEDIKKIEKLFKQHNFPKKSKKSYGIIFGKDIQPNGIVEGFLNYDKNEVNFSIRGRVPEPPLMKDPLFVNAKDNIPRVKIDDLAGLEKILKVIDKYN